ncbi:hypothetical protein SAMN05428995_10921 [Loktanella sp. DSM 29012]|uniref:hypothetical protein n=1 Tax=Loktanella sp. DSM 29012 TaxID=1881056 RepID=UPI0008B15A67|nr:hypothetical protein [Loktanella sp. DSM 29012]SEQ80092.1 hypothetical protein SAMN05428995_10921 [Loktanella sp. DSM 29012]
MPVTHYIAETDDRNAIAAVWVHRKGGRGPRVFHAGRDRFDPAEPAAFAGACELAIKRYLTDQTVS